MVNLRFRMDLIYGKPVYPQLFFPVATAFKNSNRTNLIGLSHQLSTRGRCMAGTTTVLKTHALFCTHLYYIIISQRQPDHLVATFTQSSCRDAAVTTATGRTGFAERLGEQKWQRFLPAERLAGYLSFVHFSFLEETTAKIFHSPV